MYVTIEETDAYYSNVYNSVWGSLGEDVKEILLKNATLNIDSYDYIGEKQDSEQLNKFPRVLCCGAVTDMDLVKRACMVEALAVYKNGGQASADTSGIKSFKLGNANIEFKEDAKIEVGVSQIPSILRPYIIHGVRVI